MSQPGTTTRPPIAVVGVSALFPGSSDVTGFWRDILAGTDRMTPVPPTHWLVDDYFDADPTAVDKTYGRRGGFLDPVDLDPIAFGVPPSVVPATDTAQLLALIVAQQVLDGRTDIPHDLLVPYLAFTQDDFEAVLPTIPEGGVASKEYTLDEAKKAIEANIK